MSERRPVEDWSTDFDHLGAEWSARMPEILDDLRERCPVAHTDRFFGAYLVTRYDDISEVAHNTTVFSNRITSVNENHPDNIKLELQPITLDPPEHGPLRRALLPAFNPREVAALEPWMAAKVEQLLDDIGDRTEVDGAIDFAQRVPVELMGRLFGVSSDMAVQFRQWVDALLKDGQIDLDVARKANREVRAYFVDQLERHRREPADDLVSMVLDVEIDNGDGTSRPFTERERIGALMVLMIGGIDTTWSSLGSALFHLATTPEDRRLLVEHPELIPGAIEELLRFYSPVTIARIINEDAEVAGYPVKGGQRILLSYPSANRDPAHFEHPERVDVERQQNRHMAFGVGIHRCLGSNLARMEMKVAIEGWLARYPEFELAVDPSEIEWSNGPVRGPRLVPLRILS